MQRAIIEADEEIRQPLNGAKKEPAPESAQGQPVQAAQTGAAVAQSAEEVAQTTVHDAGRNGGMRSRDGGHRMNQRAFQRVQSGTKKGKKQETCKGK